VLSFAACSPGPGRVPVFPDATVYDALPRDASPTPDAGMTDTGPRDALVVVNDAGPMVMSPFTGVFGILNAQDNLYARESDGRLNIVIGDFPYEYSGTIDEAGNVETSSPELTRSGCVEARVHGLYDRTSATYQLVHATCNTQGDPLSSAISGGFLRNFVPAFSGVFDLTADVTANPAQCWEGALTDLSLRVAINLLESGAIAVFTVQDLLPQSAWYRGMAGGDGSFTAIQRSDAGAAPTRVSIMGSFSQATEQDPLRFTGIRDVYDPVKGCAFTIAFDGTRVALP
jgi:hypothetical protein